MNGLLAAALRPHLATEGQALAFLDAARQRLRLRDSTVAYLRAAVADHFDQIADTLRDPSAAQAFCAGEDPDGQAPPTPVTAYPPAVSDMGFELDPL